MKFDDLSRVWREEGTGDVRRARVESLTDVRGRATRKQRDARRKFRRATIFWLVMVPWFLFWAVFSALRGNLLVMTAFVIFVVGCTAPAVYWKKIGKTEIDPTLPVRAAVAQEAEQLRELRRLIRRMIDWVVGSLLVGGPLLAVGTPSSSPARIVSFSLFFIVVAVLGRKEWRRLADELEAKSAELEGWVRDLESV